MINNNSSYLKSNILSKQKCNNNNMDYYVIRLKKALVDTPFHILNEIGKGVLKSNSSTCLFCIWYIVRFLTYKDPDLNGLTCCEFIVKAKGKSKSDCFLELNKEFVKFRKGE